MPIFIVPGKLTDKAIEKMKETGQRDEKTEQILRAAEGRLISHSSPSGRYDFVATIDSAFC